MLKPEENERLVRVGPGTAGGAVFRRYWQPAVLSSELPAPDGPPIRVRLLGEDLVAFRATDGAVGLVDAYCPHRRAPMFFGRNEHCGLRCVYHGWKFDVTGRCVDMPNEPPDSLFKDKVAIPAYPTWEGGGIVWTYMGPPELMPPPPDYEWLRVPPTHRFVSKTYEACNYLQGLEGGLDTAHSSFAHNERLNDPTWIRNRDTHPRLEVDKTDYGFRYASTRDLGDDGLYVRVYHYIMPAQQLRGNVTNWVGGKRAEVPKLDGHIWVPIDDEQTWVYNMMYGYDPDVAITEEFAWKDEAFFGRGKDDLIPGTFKLKANLANDYFIDREKQKQKTFTGIRGVNTQDFAIQEGMGPIPDRSKERLGTTDRAIIVTRQLLLEACDRVERGETPRALTPDTYRGVRAYDRVIERDRSWRDEFAPELVAKW
ncbi:MAG TPA: Rieske 2Fe-2S domain-containing protein [Candidatus Elarobacter sp.]|jgi:phenylpropionate dioxygenase-like ring-hydroxylating dioxygenase large terminal subunit|nr:Rieske 2Fe-2S domain-containing protein [Candidatus Elarobacter sp.]